MLDGDYELASSACQTFDSAQLTGATSSSTPGKSLAFREGMVDELASLIPDDFREGHEALEKLRRALGKLEKHRDGSSDGGGGGIAGGGLSDVMSMMVAIEQQTARVEQGLERLSGEALEIVSSAMIEIDVEQHAGSEAVDEKEPKC